MASVNKDSFCIGPWAELRIDSDGCYNYCHAAVKNSNTKETIYNIKPTEYFLGAENTPNKVRQSLLNGERVSQCERCYHDEQAGMTSFRHRRNLQAGIFPNKDFDQSYAESRLVSDLANQKNPRFYHVSLSNLCNLGCIMCHPRSSSYLSAEFKKINLIDQSQPTLTDWTSGPRWDNFCQHLLSNTDIICLHIMGGEPLYHKKFYELLDILIAAKHTNFAFTFVTNGTIYDPKLIDKLSHFQSVQVEISIEGVTNINDYIRWPSKTTIVLENIKRYLTHRTDQFDVVLRTVPQLLSVHNYDQLLSWCREHRVLIDSNPMHSPDYLHAGMLPDDLKNQIRQRLQPYVSAQQDRTRSINLRDNHDIDRALSINADFILQQLQQNYNTAERWIQFRDYHKSLDAIRGISLIDYAPELKSILNQYDR
jgi:sulfatase maturation enzyme AslB (radical SAM superfamily)